MDLISRVISGYGSYRALQHYLKPEQRVLFLTDQHLSELESVATFRQWLGQSCKQLSGYTHIPPEPTRAGLEAIVAGLGSGFDAVVALGGGSVLDVAKIIAVTGAGRQSVSDLVDSGRVLSRLPLFMLPTTAGTGSEATPNAIFAVPEQNSKMAIIDQALKPDLIVLDPVFIETLPPHLIASTGFDALAHCLECISSNKNNSRSEHYGVTGAALILKNLEAAYRNPSDIAAQQALLFASFCGGQAINYAGTHIIHALSYPLGGRYRIPHGIANAMLLQRCFENREPVYQHAFSLVAEEMGVTMETGAYRYLMDQISRLHKALALPETFREAGIAEFELELVVQDALQVKRLLGNCPYEVTEQEISAIYESFL